MFTGGSPWEVVATFGTVLDAEFAAATLQEAGIPAQVHGAHVGIWGAGYQGPSMYGVRLAVPHHRADDARALLDDLFGDEEEDEA
jgi:hypothetical protein